MPLYTRQTTGLTMLDLLEREEQPSTFLTVPTDKVAVDLMAPVPIVKVKNGTENVEIPIAADTLEWVGKWAEVPTRFLMRHGPQIQQPLLNALLAEKGEQQVVLRYNDQQGILDAHGPQVRRVPKREILDIASRVVGGDAEVIDWRDETRGYSFDVCTAHSELGDRAVGDITNAGLRFGHDVQHNLMPTVQPWIYRLVCTNGMEIPDVTTVLQVQQSDTIEKILEDFETLARDAFGNVDHLVEEFYRLREVKVPHPERVLARIAHEQRISPANLVTLLDAMPEYLDDDGEATMFDIVNAITNMGANPALDNNPRQRANFERLGGNVMSDETARCRHCQSRLHV